jgi:hypothetical protein
VAVWTSSKSCRALSDIINTPTDRLCSHFNSVDKFPDGDFLVSSRHTSTIYKVSHTDGSIVWRLGGPDSDWILPTDGLFTRQHDARVHEVNATHTIISFFDNHFGFPGYSTKTKGHSRGLVVALLANDRKVEIVTKADHPRNKISESRGSNQILPNGNLFVSIVVDVIPFWNICLLSSTTVDVLGKQSSNIRTQF